MQNGDYLLWVDSNDVLISDPQPIFDYVDINHIYLHDHYPTFYPNWQWTQQQMFERMGCTQDKFKNCPQIQVNIMGFKKNKFVCDFVDEWVAYSTDYDTMIGNDIPNPPGFQDHRHEQSVASILREKYDIPFAVGYPYGIAHEEMGISV
jgi:hypothetical protein